MARRKMIFLTANDVERASRDEWENVKILADFLAQLFDEYGTLFIEDVDKFLEDFEMESWSQHFASLMPFAAFDVPGNAMEIKIKNFVRSDRWQFEFRGGYLCSSKVQWPTRPG
jgi:hypothetical protein